MPIQTVQIEYEATIKAVLREDSLDISLTVAMPYEGRKASIVHSDFSQDARDAIRQVLKAATEEQLAVAIKKAQLAAHEAAMVAARVGEL